MTGSLLLPDHLAAEKQAEKQAGAVPLQVAVPLNDTQLVAYMAALIFEPIPRDAKGQKVPVRDVDLAADRAIELFATVCARMGYLQQSGRLGQLIDAQRAALEAAVAAATGR